MNYRLTIRFLILGLVFLCQKNLHSQCSVDAGDDIIICQGETAYLTVSDGITPLPQGATYSWKENGVEISTDYFAYVTPNTSTLYTVELSTGAGCSASDEIMVIVGTTPTINLNNITNATCGNSDGSLTVSASGTGNVNYIWSNGESGATLSGIPSGTYTVTVVDDFGCSNSSAYVVSVNGDTGISGKVYGDFNYNANNDQVFQGYANIEIRLYGSDADGNSVLVSSVDTDVNGNFNFPNVDFTNGQIYRMEYIIPFGYYVTTEGDIDNLQVRYMSGPSCNEDLAISIPTDYCHTEDPLYTTTSFINGDPLAGGNAGGRDAIGTTNYLDTGFPGSADYTPYTSEAIGSQVGSLYGIAYHRYSKLSLYSAYLKRHVGLGPGGLGAIYGIDYSSGTGGTPYEYVNLATDLGINVGEVLNRDLPANWGSPSRDADAYVKIGKVGIGDIDISDDGKTLYVTNLFDKTLILIDIQNPVTNNPTLSATLPTPNPGCGDDWRPFALKYYAGKLYLGGVCSGESDGSTPEAYVYEFDPETNTFAAADEYIVNFPFDWTRGAGGGAQWGAWDSEWPSSGVSQPMLTDIEFEVDGAMILGVRNRSGDQYGFQNYSTNDGDNTLYSIFAPGDVLRADPNGDGSYTLENNGESLGKTGCGANNGEGPGGGEFFCGDAYLGHTETATGALAKFAGSGEAMSTVIDPFRAWSQGVVRFSVTDGSPLTAYEFIQSDTNNPDGFGKANGLGDIEVFCDPAPIEVGDYVWIDDNNNGIQDPEEEPIKGATISLYAEDGTLVDQTTTDDHGYYYFNTGLEFETNYFIVVEDSEDGFEYNGENLILTIPNANGNQHDLIDSDATIKGFGVPDNVLDKASISFTTGLPGETNHSLDIGFYDCVLPVDAGQDVAICNGQCVTLTASALGGFGNTECQWNTGEENCSITVCPNETRTYTVTITDELGCKGTDNVTVTVEAQPISDIIAPDFTCPAVEVTFEALDAGAGSTYEWNFDGGVTADGDTDDRVEQVTFPNALAETTRTVTLRVYSLGGCFSDYEHEIEIGSEVWADAGDANVGVCTEGCVEIGGTPEEIAVPGGTYVWSPSDYLSSTTISNPEVCLPDGVNTMTYTLTVSKNGCVATDQVTVTKDSALDPIADAGDDVLSCNSEPVVLGGNPTGSLPAGSTDVITGYLWSPSNGLSSIVVANPTATTNVTRTYTVKVFTESGCVAEDEVTVTADLCDDLSLGNVVWNDNNNNGIFDGDESPIQGVKLILWEDTDGDNIPDVNTGLTATTNADGEYLFTNLVPGDYIVQVDPTSFNNGNPLEGYNSSTGNGEAPDPDNDVNNDDNGEEVAGFGIISKAITLDLNSEPTNDGDTDNNTNLTVDFGFFARVSIGSTVFVDNNDNGIQDMTEGGIEGVTVELLDENGDVVDTDVTDADGNYFFDDLMPGVYQVRIPTPDVSYPTSSTPTDTNDNSQDNDDNGDQPGGSGTAVTSPLITLSPGNETTNEPSSGGTQDDAEDSNGDMTIDFGFIPAELSIGSTVFIDANDNGIFDDGEEGLEGITVELLDENGDVIDTDVTDADGNYFFDGLSEGDYQIRIPNPDDQYPTSSSNTDTNDNGQDNDDNGDQPGGTGTAVTSPVINLAAGQETTNEPGSGGDQDDANDANGDMTVDFGFVPELMSIGSTVFLDYNDNGIQDAGEEGIQGVTVQLLDDNGDVIDTDITDADGNYFFDGLAPGDYQVRIPNTPEDYPTSSSNTDTNDNSEDNDDNGDQPGGSGTAVTSPVITLSPGTETTDEPGSGGDQDDANDANGDMTVDFGFIPEVDLNLIKVVDNGLPSIGENVTFTITVTNEGPSDATGVQVTDNLPSGYTFVSASPAGVYNNTTGIWNIGNLADGASTSLQITATVLATGDYTNIAEITNTNEPDTDSTPDNGPDTDGDGNIGSQDDGDPNDTEDPDDEDDADDAVVQPQSVGSIGSTVFLDYNDNGILDAGEEGIQGVTVQLLDDNGDVIDTDVTDADGNYFFDGLAPGDYQVRIPNTPEDYPTSSSNTDTNDNSEDNDDNGDQPGGSGSAVTSPVITLTVNGETTNEPGTGGDQDDANDNDGDMTVDFGFIPEVDLNLIKVVDNGLPSIGENVTFTITVTNEGPSDATGVQVTDNLPSGYTFVSASPAGVYNNTTGIWNIGNLADGASTSLQITATVLATGDYTNIAEITNTNEPDTDSTPDNGPDTDGDGNIGSQDDGDPNDTEDPDDEDDADDAVVQPQSVGSIGSTVFLDYNDNGILDAGEEGIQGVTVQLLDDNGDVIDTDVTDADGNYFFDGLAPGDYQVRIPNTPEDYPTSSSNTDTNDNSEDNDDNGDQPGGSGTAVTSPVITLTVNGETTNEPGTGGDQDDANDNDGDMTVDFGFIPEVDLNLIKVVDNGLPSIGENVTFTITVTNEGPSDATGVQVTDNLPSGYTFVSASPAGVYNNTTGIWNIGNLADGASTSLQITATVLATGDYTNIAEITNTNEPDTDSTPDNGPDTDGDGNIGSQDDGDPNDTEDPDDEDDADDAVVQPQSVGSIGSTVFLDYNDNGILDAGEEGIQGVTVQLLDDNGDVIDTDVTDADGNYFFDGLAPGDYQVRIPNAPEDYPTSSSNTDTNDNSEDNDDNGDQPGGSGTAVISPVITLTPNGETTNEPGTGGDQDDANDNDGDMTVDFGFIPEVDLNLIKIVDQSLVNIGENVTFTITVTNEGPSDATGVQVTDNLPSGYTFVSASPAGVYNNTTGIWNIGNLADGASTSLQITATVTGVNDYINIAEITSTNEPDTDSTPGNGADTDGDGDIGSQDPDSTFDPDDEDDGDDAFVIPQAVGSIGSTVFLDSNSNGMLDAGEEGIPGITVQLLDDNGDVIDTDVTDADGNYFFDGLAPGDYQVRIPNTPEDYPTSSPNTDMNDNGQDNDDNGDQPGGSGTAVISPVITLTPNGETTNEPGTGGNQDNANDDDGDMTVDFGFIPEVDLNLIKVVNDGLPSIGDNVTFTITVTNEGPSDATGVQVTDNLPSGFSFVSATPNTYNPNTGIWNIGNLADGASTSLQITATVLANGDYTNIAEITDVNETDTDSTPDNGPDTDGDGNIGSQDDGDPNDTEDPDDEDDADDATVTPVGTISGYVWEDSDGDGDGDTPIVGIQLTLLDENNNPVGTARTDGNGFYEFVDLLPGNYTIVEQPETEINPEYLDVYDGDESNDGDPTDGILNTDDIINVVLTLGEDDEDNNFVEILESVLPVEYEYFRGHYDSKEDVNKLEWATVSEVNNDYFKVFRKFEDGNWVVIDEVEGQGNSNTLQVYNLPDSDIDKDGIYYYRLKQVDYNGNFEFTDIISIVVNRDATTVSSIYPNPARHYINLDIVSNYEGNVQVSIVDDLGRLVRSESVYYSNNTIQYDINDLSPGSYVMKLDVDQTTMFHKFVVIR